MRKAIATGRLRTLGVAALLVSALTVTMSLPGSGASTSAQTKARARVYNFVLSNNFLGNDWRPQMEQLAKLTANLAPFKGTINLKVVNSQSTTEAQIADLNNIIQSKPDVILVDAGSPTALNPTIKRACAAGIDVISFDQPVTEPCAWRVLQDHGAGQLIVGQWMAKVLNGSGSVFVDRGLPGAPISTVIHDSFLAGMKKYGPNITVAGEYDGQYSQGPEQQGISSLLVGHPDVKGVMTQGYCKPVFNAFKNAGKPAVPATCYGYNGELVACAKGHYSCAILTGSPIVVQQAMELGLNAVEGKPTPPKNKVIPVLMKLYVTNMAQVKLVSPVVQVEQIQIGKNCFPALAPGLALPYTLPRYSTITPQQAAGRS
jgi:ribose transport system substrate-binding protein